MSSLHELQHAFIAGVLHGDVGRIAARIDANGIAPERRLSIHRNNAVEGFLKTLEATFPVLVKLAGLDWFRQTGRAYMRAHPSRSGNLHYLGEHFAAFLSTELADTQFDYFSDVARLEWAYQEVLVAADHPGFDVGALAGVSPEDYGQLRFTRHPAMRLVASLYPILAIWKANRPDSPESPEVLSLDAGASHVVVLRREDHVELRELPIPDFALLGALAGDATLAEAADAAMKIDEHLELGASLARIIRLGALVDFTTAPREDI